MLAYAWAAYPFTALRARVATPTTRSSPRSSSARCSPPSSPPARAARSPRWPGLAKFAPLALAPLLATHRLRERGLRALVRRSLLAFAAVAALVAIPALEHNTLATIYDRTISYQAERSAPFSIWGLYGGLGSVQTVVRLAAIALARRARDPAAPRRARRARGLPPPRS